MKRVEVGLQTESIAVNHLTGTLAVGTQYGEIVLFRNVSDYLRFFYFNSAKTIAEKDLFDSIVVKSKLIWHSHGVKSLAFSSDGRILYSGGEESVLTMWNLNKSLKSFIPRVGGPISHLVSFQ
jgi:NET1-associated nuclear protein 1 (U3 small nucleolar RNA-associated protein 17)